MIKSRKRCAIYTRKSSEEGLEQEFNSLHAQRDAGSDYIRSQKHEGWEILGDHYDDGAYSGGNINRPALKKLLTHIQQGRIDVVVVYKVDRLSRSLHDFAQLMSTFDENNVTFVSVTQQFNTTTSMGRLTLNMLLSFAQFEREVTGERIRDKVAATKKKGMWFGGNPPLGYKIKDKKLNVIDSEAETVRNIFKEYLNSGSLLELSSNLNRRGARTKRWKSKKGNWRGGSNFNPNSIHKILTNPIYIGKIRHGDKFWDGLHKGIVSKGLWDNVQTQIEKRSKQTVHRWNHSYLLKGKLRTHEGFAMSPSSVHRSQKKTSAKTQVLYYVSQKAINQGYKSCQIKTINAAHLDNLIRDLTRYALPSGLDRFLPGIDSVESDHWLRQVIDQVILGPEHLEIQLDNEQVEELPTIAESNMSDDRIHETRCNFTPMIRNTDQSTIIELKIQIKKYDGKRLIVSPEGMDLTLPTNPTPRADIVKAFGKAYKWREQINDAGMSIAQLARNENISPRNIRKHLSLTHLGPTILASALDGTLSHRISINRLLSAARSLDWENQQAVLAG